MQNNTANKKQEIWMLVVLGLVLFLIILICKFVIGINFGLMEQDGYISIGYHEVHGAQTWALEFESFTGTISSEGKLPENTKRRLQIYSGAENAKLHLKMECGKEKVEYTLDGTPLDIIIPGTKDKFTMTISGVDVLSGYFSAVWE